MGQRPYKTSSSAATPYQHFSKAVVEGGMSAEATGKNTSRNRTAGTPEITTALSTSKKFGYPVASLIILGVLGWIHTSQAGVCLPQEIRVNCANTVRAAPTDESENEYVQIRCVVAKEQDIYGDVKKFEKTNHRVALRGFGLCFLKPFSKLIRVAHL